MKQRNLIITALMLSVSHSLTKAPSYFKPENDKFYPSKRRKLKGYQKGKKKR